MMLQLGEFHNNQVAAVAVAIEMDCSELKYAVSADKCTDIHKILPFINNFMRHIK